MTEEEAFQIAEYVAAACPAQKFGEFTPDVWGEILKPYSVDEARTAVIAVARRQPWISPAEIVEEIKARREERIELAHVVYDGNPDETGAQSAASRRALIRAAADGHLPPRTYTAAIGTADRLALPPGEPGPYTGRVAAARAAIGQATPTAREGVTNPRAISCRICKALPGASCEVRGRRMREVHPARLEDAKRRAAGLPPVDPAEDRLAEERVRAAAAVLAADDRTVPPAPDTTEEPS
ncbi:zinc finger domain-containing protein [Streptomyces rubiginosohelvolus]|uniref:Uncharacterized protein n=1 Tax=Streptomyces rubiginosohelvolus TaxID=67362 RepID=A0ABQ3BN73_9ACTN|nr:hypothetical protein [Streptomyces pluricolorescens]GGZ51517.1 hypothetical protein GCM10010328_27700 [Streptomyces pluricolorescens]